MQDVVVEDEPLFAADSKDRRRILTHARVVSDFRNRTSRYSLARREGTT